MRALLWLGSLGGKSFEWNLSMPSKTDRQSEVFKNCVAVVMVALILFGVLQLFNVIHV
jgi:hypothetical protein